MDPLMLKAIKSLSAEKTYRDAEADADIHTHDAVDIDDTDTEEDEDDEWEVEVGAHTQNNANANVNALNGQNGMEMQTFTRSETDLSVTLTIPFGHEHTNQMAPPKHTQLQRSQSPFARHISVNRPYHCAPGQGVGVPGPPSLADATSQRVVSVYGNASV